MIIITAAVAVFFMAPSAFAAPEDVDVSISVTTVDLDSAQVWLKVSLTWPAMPVAGSSMAFVPYRCLDAAEVVRVGNDSRSALTGPASNGSGTLVQILGPASSSSDPWVVHLPRCIATLASSGTAGEVSFIALDTQPSQISTATVRNLSIQGAGVRYASPGGTNVSADRIEINPVQRSSSPQTRIYLSSGLEAGGVPLILVGLFIMGITAGYSWIQRSENAFSVTKLAVAIFMVIGILAIMVIGWYQWQFLRNLGVVSVAAAGVGHGLAMIIVQTSIKMRERPSLQENYPARDVGAGETTVLDAGEKSPGIVSAAQTVRRPESTSGNAEN